MQVPEIMINHAMHEYDRIAKLIQRNTAMARVDILAAMCIINVARKLGVIIYRDTLLGILGIQLRDFRRIMMQVLSFNKDILVLYVPNDGKSETRRIVARVVSTVNACIDATGENIPRLACALHRILSKNLVGMREDTKIAVIAYLVIKKSWPEFSSLSCIASGLHCRISSIYNALTRILKRMGVNIHAQLSKLDLSRRIDMLLDQEKAIPEPI